MKSRNRTSRFLITSLVIIVILSIGVFSYLAFFLNQQSDSTIREVSRMYMSSMSEQITGTLKRSSVCAWIRWTR